MKIMFITSKFKNKVGNIVFQTAMQNHLYYTVTAKKREISMYKEGTVSE